jgi:hypothetical protein
MRQSSLLSMRIKTRDEENNIIEDRKDIKRNEI